MLPLTTISSPAPSATVRLVNCVSVPPASTTVWSVVTTVLKMVTLCVFRITISLELASGTSVAGLATSDEKSATEELSHVPTALQSPDVTDLK